MGLFHVIQFTEIQSGAHFRIVSRPVMGAFMYAELFAEVAKSVATERIYPSCGLEGAHPFQFGQMYAVKFRRLVTKSGEFSVSSGLIPWICMFHGLYQFPSGCTSHERVSAISPFLTTHIPVSHTEALLAVAVSKSIAMKFKSCFICSLHFIIPESGCHGTYPCQYRIRLQIYELIMSKRGSISPISEKNYIFAGG